MPSLTATLGINASNFKSGLDGAVRQASVSGKQIEQNLSGGLGSKLRGLMGSVGGAGAASVALVAAFAAKVASTIDGLIERAKEIKGFSAASNLTTQQAQPVLFSAQASNVSPDAVANAIGKIAEAQVEVARGGPGAAKALAAFSEFGVTLSDLKSKSYQELFLQISESMHVARLSAAQLTAGGDLMGKAFDGLQPMFKRGFNDPVDQMKTLTDEEIKRLATMNRNVAILKEGWSTAWAEVANFVVKHSPGSNKSLLDDDDTQDNEKRLQERLTKQQAAKAKVANAARQKGLDEAAENKRLEPKIQALRELQQKNDRGELTQEERLVELQKERLELLKAIGAAKTQEGRINAATDFEKNRAETKGIEKAMEKEGKAKPGKLDINSNQRIGAYASNIALPEKSGLENRMLSETQTQTKVLLGIHSALMNPRRTQEDGVRY